MRLTQVAASAPSCVGQTIGFCRLPGAEPPWGRQATENDGLPHEAALTIRGPIGAQDAILSSALRATKCDETLGRRPILAAAAF
jgi:hypothetical protein